jgi:adenine-specific DNA methylase
MKDHKPNENDVTEQTRPQLKIEGNLPIRTVGIETQRERINFTDLPPQSYVHVWWARRPTPVSRLAILASTLPNNVTEDELLRWMEIDPSNLSSKDSISQHVRKKKKEKEKIGTDGAVYEHYGYKKIWKRTPSEEKLNEITDRVKDTWNGEMPTVLDATAGGGSIPFESVRYGFPTIANELNPVASVILKAVLEHPRVDGDLSDDIRKWGEKLNDKASEELKEFYPTNSERREPLNYLWANTVSCPDCGLEVPLSPNWWIDKESGSKGLAVQPSVSEDTDQVEFNLVELPADIEKDDYNPTNGTVSRGEGECLRCGVAIEGDEIKQQAQNDEMDYQLYAVEYRDIGDGSRKNFRSPNKKDIRGFEKARDVVENDPELANLLRQERYVGPADRSANYGLTEWRDVYSPRQLLTHYTYWQVFENIKESIREEYPEPEANALITFLAVAADKGLDYNCRLSVWDNTVPKIAHVFSRHDFAFAWSFVEMNMTADGGYSWVLENVVGAYEDLHELSGDSDATTKITQEDATNLSLDDKEVQVIVLDPPYYDNVMYSELSDFFYVWLKKYLDDVYPNFFQQNLTDKHNEAVANPSKFEDVADGNTSKRELAQQDYEDKMTGIFAEMHRVLSDDGIFTLMFTHKKTEAWDTLTKALINAGFSVKATHPVSTESQLSLHQAGKNAAESTILLTSEKRDTTEEQPTLWEDVKRETRQAAQARAKELDDQESEFAKVDMVLASFGPTLRVFTEHYPVVDEEGNEITPQVALDEARDSVTSYLNNKYLNTGIEDVDPKTEWYVHAWLMFEAKRFPYDEARRHAINVGIDLDDLKRSHRIWRKRSGDVVLRPSEERVQNVNKKPEDRSSRKPVDPEALSFAASLNKVHAVLQIYDKKGATEAWNWMNQRGCGSDPEFKATIEALLRVLPHDHEDWEIAQALAAGDTGELLELDLDKDIFNENEDSLASQSEFSDF